jgi:signal peptidase I
MRRSLRVLSLAAVVAAAAAAWFFLAPVQLGGSTSYAVIYGSSMEPHLHRGDLVILRKQPAYERGQVVGYHSRELHRNVLHRIVGIRGDHFVFKGDNNGFLDPEQPARSQLFGHEWTVLPGVGGLLERLRSPRGAAVAAGLAVLLILGGGSGAGVRRRRRPGPARREPAQPSAVAPSALPRPRSQARRPSTAVALALGLLGTSAVLLGVAVGVLAARQPTQRTVADPGLYVQRGAFSWSSPAPVGAVYQSSSLRPSDPVFLRLVHALEVRFTYRVHSALPAGFSGSAQLDALLSDGDGWQRRLVLARDRRFHGNRIVLTGKLDLQAVVGAVRRFEAQTGVHSAVYRLDLASRVRIRGVAGGRLVRTTFAPSLSFDLDGLRLQLARPTTGAAPQARVQTKVATGARTVQSTVTLFGIRARVAVARHLSLIIAGSGIAFVLAGGILFRRRRQDGEVAEIERRYGDLIVAVAAGERLPGSERRVSTMEALVRIAERYDRLVLHEEHWGGHSFLVDDAGVVYRYDVGAPPDATTEIRFDEARHLHAGRVSTAD